MYRYFHYPIGTFLALALSTTLHAETVLVAVAANFTAPMNAIAADFERETGHKAQLSFGATGKFYAQIKRVAALRVYRGAYDETPRKLEQEGDAVPGTAFTYTTGRLVLWSAKPGFVDAQGQVLKTGTFNKLALAAPKLARLR